jgi:hypothetical protein
MRHFEMRFATRDYLYAAAAANPAAIDEGDAYAITDPSGIQIRIAKTLANALGQI